MTNLKFLEFSGHFDRFSLVWAEKRRKKHPLGRRQQFIIGTLDGVKDTFRLPYEHPHPPQHNHPPKKKHLQL